MYLRHYGLDAPPFELTSDPAYLFLTPGHREALANLVYGIASAKPITVVTGEAGTGKTTVLRAALELDRCRAVRRVLINNPELSRSEFVETLARQFDLSEAAAASKPVFLAELDASVRERHRNGETAALIVDEAQRLSDDLLEEVRLLSNIETNTEKLLPVILVGQPELADRLNQSRLRQLKQRVALRCEIAPFTFSQTAAYIAHRIRKAGGEAGRLFTREAVTAVHEYARGIPRSVNVICDNALLSAFAAGLSRADRRVVEDVTHDFHLTPIGAEKAMLGEGVALGETARTLLFPAPNSAQHSLETPSDPLKDHASADTIDMTTTARSSFLDLCDLIVGNRGVK